MMHPEEADWLGYLAAILVFCSFYARTIAVLRLVAITSNMAFIGYGLAKGLYPVLVLHTVLLPLNCLRLAQLRPPGSRHRRWGFGATVLVVLAAIGVFGLGASGSAPLGLDRVAFVQPEPVPAWVQRVARVDEALGRSELSRAIYEWREAYGAAVKTKRSEGLIAVAHRAVRIAEVAGGSGYFLNEARYIYRHAAFRARAERSPQAILGIAEAFDKLGDTERANYVRRLAEQMS